MAVEPEESSTGDGERQVSDRDRRAASELLFAYPVASGMFDVYSESGTAYTVDLREFACECEDFRYRTPDGGCKHIRRVLMLIGVLEIPAGVEPDPLLVDRRP